VGFAAFAGHLKRLRGGPQALPASGPVLGFFAAAAPDATQLVQPHRVVHHVVECLGQRQRAVDAVAGRQRIGRHAFGQEDLAARQIQRLGVAGARHGQVVGRGHEGPGGQHQHGHDDAQQPAQPHRLAGMRQAFQRCSEGFVGGDGAGDGVVGDGWTGHQAARRGRNANKRRQAPRLPVVLVELIGPVVARLTGFTVRKTAPARAWRLR
jgi:hypothetical protein